MPASSFRLPVTLFALSALAILSAAAAQSPDVALPYSEGFEGAGLPAGWTDASRGELAVVVAAEPKGVQEGKAALRVHVPGWEAGQAELRRGRLPLKAGTVYSVELWLRGQDLEVPVWIAVRPGAAGQPPHVQRPFALGSEWRRCAVSFRAEKDDPEAVLSLSFAGSGTVWIDGLRVVQGELPPAPEPLLAPVKGNRIHNSSFELGADGWTMAEGVAVVSGETPEGKKFARWLPSPFPFQCRPFRARPGQQVTVSMLLRSQRPEARAVVSLIELGNETRTHQEFALTSEWKRYSFSAVLPCRRSTRHFLSLATADRTYGLDVDAVQIEEGDQTAYAPAASLELSSGLTRAQAFPHPDRAVGVPVQIYSRQGIPEKALVQLRLVGFYGETVGRYRAELTPGATHAEQPIQIRVPLRGTVRMLLEAQVDGQTVSTGEQVLTVLPEADPKPNRDSFFGGHGSVGTTGEWHAPSVAARAGMRWWRLHDLSAFTEWEVAEPERGQFAWYDDEVNALRTRGFSLLGVLARTPEWAGEDPGGEQAPYSAWPPARIADFGRYLREVSGHYRGRVDAYELWNEPWSRRWWAGSPEQYAELAKAGAGVLRAVDPNLEIVGGSFFVPQPEFTDRVLGKELAPALGAASYHHYVTPEAVTYDDGGRDQVTRWTEALRRKLDLSGGEKLPLLNTEGGVASPGYYSAFGAEEQSRTAARALAKMLVLSRANGVRRFFYYHVWQELGASRLFDWPRESNWSLLDYDGSGKPALAAYAGCARSMEGAEPFARFEKKDVKAYLFRRGRHTLLVMWSPTAPISPRDIAIKLDRNQVRVFNLMGNPRPLDFEAGQGLLHFLVRNEPLYVHVLSTEPEAVLEAVKVGLRRYP